MLAALYGFGFVEALSDRERVRAVIEGLGWLLGLLSLTLVLWLSWKHSGPRPGADDASSLAPGSNLAVFPSRFGLKELRRPKR